MPRKFDTAAVTVGIDPGNNIVKVGARKAITRLHLAATDVHKAQRAVSG